MAYFLKKTNRKNDVYLQIYESRHDPVKKYAVHSSVEVIGYVKELIANGITDPYVYAQNKVDNLNREFHKAQQAKKTQKIGSTPLRNVGYFMLAQLYEKLNLSKDIQILSSGRQFQFSTDELLQALIYARFIDPCSKKKSMEDVFPSFYKPVQFSKDQIYDALDFLGNNYEKVIEILNHQMHTVHRRKTDKVYFDCTNYYFEIDREDEWRRKGPCKENRHDPIIGMGLLLDSAQIPMGMKIYPGNQSEKPVLRDIISDMKERHNITGRTVQVADKGLNCGTNIIEAIRENDGYIFSRSPKTLSANDLEWVLNSEGYRDINDADGTPVYRVKSDTFKVKVAYTDRDGKNKEQELRQKWVATMNYSLQRKQQAEIEKLVNNAVNLSVGKAKRNEYGDAASFVTFYSINPETGEATNRIQAGINEEAVQRAKRIAGYNLIVTSELDMTDTEIYSVYHNLWRIEESFRILKTQLATRPIYLQKENTIKGHLLVCYLAVTLLRLIQFEMLKGVLNAAEIVEFIKKFNVLCGPRECINTLNKSPVVDAIAAAYKVPVNNYYLTHTQIEKMFHS